ncbi:LysM domain-containing protein, partial [Lacrimispora sp.]
MMTSCPEGLFSYTIQSGDTLWLISRRHYTTVEAIMAANPGINPGNLQVGQMICIPSGNRTSQPQTQPT